MARTVMVMLDGLGETHGISLAKPGLPPRGRKVLTTNELRAPGDFHMLLARIHFFLKLKTRGKFVDGPSNKWSSRPLRYLLKKETRYALIVNAT